MFELLLLIYLLPVIFVAALLLKLVLWLVKKIFQLAGWLIKRHILSNQEILGYALELAANILVQKQAKTK